MLQSLRIQNIALLPEAEIEFGRQFNIISGETGAGKSIIIGSFNFILGEKLNKTIIRQGASSARVDAVFKSNGVTLAKIAALCGVEFEDNIAILSRQLKADGKNECRINGHVITASMLKDAASYLVSIHGQHETETLLKPKNHVTVIDGFGGQKINNAKQKYEQEREALAELKGNLKRYGGTKTERKRTADIYQYQIKEIENAKLRFNEDTLLAEKKQRMTGFEKISAAVTSASSAFPSLNKVLSALSGATHLDTKLEKIVEHARSVQYELAEVESNLRDYGDNLEFDEDEFKQVDARLDEIKILKRKYGATIEEIFSFLAEAKASLDFFERSEEEMEKTKQEIATQQKVVNTAAKKLNEARKDSAERLEGLLIEELKTLGMPNCKFQVNFSGADEEPNDIEFYFSANKGEDIRPLANIISGGEMSRFMLALKNVTAGLDGVETLVFDEIDTGISGNMGVAIAEKMARLSRYFQVIAVTHLPQVAAMADTHFLVRKDEVGVKTVTDVIKLAQSGELSEIARLLGMAAANETAQKHAVEMKKWAEEFKRTV